MAAETPPVVRFQLLTADSATNERGETIVRMAGRSDDGRSVVVCAHDQRPYFYVKLLPSMLDALNDEEGTRPKTNLVNDFVRALHKHLAPTIDYSSYKRSIQQGAARLTREERHYFMRGDDIKLIVAHELVRVHDYDGFAVLPCWYLKLSFRNAAAHTAARYALLLPLGEPPSESKKTQRRPAFEADMLNLLFPGREELVNAAISQRRGPRGYASCCFTLAEANIPLHHQVLADNNLACGKWISVPPPRGSLGVHPRYGSKVSPTADVELYHLCGEHGQLTEALLPIEVASNAPLRVLSFDLEVFCKPLGDGAMRFYEATEADGRILCVSAVTYVVGSSDPCVGRVFALQPPDSSDSQKIGGVEQAVATDGSALRIKWFTDEPSLIKAFCDFVVRHDSDVITGWNTDKFDWPFFYKRCDFWGIADYVVTRLGRWGHTEFDFSDKAWHCAHIPGRVVHDGMVWMRKNRNLREYRLDFCATEFGLDGKDDVSYSQIAELYQTHAGRIKLAVYCELDSRLVCLLLRHKALDVFGKTLSLAALTGSPPEDLLWRGSIHTLRLCLLRWSHRDNFVLSCPSFGAEEIDAALGEEARELGAKAVKKGEESDDDDDDEPDAPTHTRYQGVLCNPAHNCSV